MNASKILFVDDDPNLLAGFQRTLRKQFTLDTAVSGQEGLELLKSNGPYGLVVADMRMPGMDGIEFLEQVRVNAPDTVRIMLTGNADQQTAVDAVNRGHVFRFLNKPCPPEVLVPAIETGLKQYELTRLEKELLEGTLSGSVGMLTDVLGLVAPAALGKGQKLRESMSRFAKWIGAVSTWEFELGALLSPIGMAAVPSDILTKLSNADPLFPTETLILRRAPKIGHDLLEKIPRLAEVARIVLYQQKHFDGSGFPDDPVAGAEIPLGARMLKILLDRLDLEADGTVKEKAFRLMEQRAGVYDPALLTKCFECLPSFLVNAMAANRPVITVTCKQLVPGHVVVSEICTVYGLVLVGSGNLLTATMIERIRNYGELGDVKEPLFVQEPETNNGPRSS